MNKKEFCSIIQSSSIIDDVYVYINIGSKTIVKSEVLGTRNKFVEYIEPNCFYGEEVIVKVKKKDIISCINNVVGDLLRMEYCSSMRNIRLFNPKYDNELIVCSTYG